jgi:hypothetical protein
MVRTRVDTVHRTRADITRIGRLAITIGTESTEHADVNRPDGELF